MDRISPLARIQKRVKIVSHAFNRQNYYLLELKITTDLMFGSMELDLNHDSEPITVQTHRYNEMVFDTKCLQRWT